MDFYRNSIVTFKSKSAQCNGQAVYVLLYDFMYCLMTSCTAWWLYVLLDDFMYWLMNLRTILDDFMYWLINLLTADDFLHCRITLCTDWLIYLLLMTLCSAWWLYVLLDDFIYCLMAWCTAWPLLTTIVWTISYLLKITIIYSRHLKPKIGLLWKIINITELQKVWDLNSDLSRDFLVLSLYLHNHQEMV